MLLDFRQYSAPGVPYSVSLSYVRALAARLSQS
jgi:hypothetical protein